MTSPTILDALDDVIDRFVAIDFFGKAVVLEGVSLPSVLDIHCDTPCGMI